MHKHLGLQTSTLSSRLQSDMFPIGSALKEGSALAADTDATVPHWTV